MGFHTHLITMIKESGRKIINSHMKIKNKFKQTDIGEIPEDWEVRKLGDIVEYSLGKTPSRRESKYWSKDGKGFHWVSISDMKPFSIINSTSEKITKEALKIMPTDIVTKGTLLMSFKLTIGRTSILDVDAFHNEAIISIRPKDDVIRDFLLYYLPTINYSQYQDRAVKGQTLNKSKLNNLPIPLPPKPEQERISNLLSKIQEVVENQEKLIEKLTELKSATMAKLFREGLNKKPLKQTDIGEIPEDWEVKKIGEVCEVVSGGTPTKNNKEFWENGNIPWIKSGQCEDRKIIKAEEYITKFGLNNSSAKMLKPYTVLVAMVGATIGKTALLTFSACTNQNICGLYSLEEKKLSQIYLFYTMQYRYNVFNSQKGFTIANLSFIKDILIPLPPKPEQEEIANILTKIDNKIEIEEKKLEVYNELFNSMLDKLMTGKIRV